MSTLCAALLLWSIPQSLVDVVGVGPAMGRVGTVTATANGGSAAYYNPAGLAYRDAPEVRLGVQGLVSRLRIDEQNVDLGAPVAIALEAASPLPFSGAFRDVLAVGVLLQALPSEWPTITLPESREPILATYQNRVQRWVLMPALAVRPHPNLALGVGVNAFFGGASLDAAALGPLQRRDTSLAASAHAGVRAQWREFAVGFSFRQAFSTELSGEGGQSVVRGQAFYTPETYTLGVAYDGQLFDAAMDISWRRWSRWRPPFLERPGQSAPAALHWVPVPRDVWRVGGTARRRLFDTPAGVFHLMGGYAYEPSPFEGPGVDLETTPQNILDGAKHIFGGGVHWALPSMGILRWRVDLSTQLQSMADVRVQKDAARLPDENPSLPGRQTQNPGYPLLGAGGWLWSGTISIAVEFGPYLLP